MHDIKMLRADPAAFDAAMARRGVAPVASEALRLDDLRVEAIRVTQAAQTTRNDLSRKIGAAMKAGDTAEAERLKAAVKAAMDNANPRPKPNVQPANIAAAKLGRKERPTRAAAAKK
jgi:seryl-tRNA synthetase